MLFYWWILKIDLGRKKFDKFKKSIYSILDINKYFNLNFMNTNIPTNDEVKEVLLPLWTEAVLDPKYDKYFEYFSQTDNNPEEIVDKQVEKIKNKTKNIY